MKKIMIVSLILFAISNTSGVALNYAEAASRQEGIKVLYNGSKLTFDVNPYIKNGRTLVPFRRILEAFGAEVGWDKEQQTVTARKNSTEVLLTLGEKYAYVNGQEIALDVPAEISGGRTFVPIRFISESMGAEVGWNSSTRTINIQFNDKQYKLGEYGAYKDIKFSIDKISSNTYSGKLKITGKLSVNSQVIVEIADDYGYVLPGNMKAVKKEGDFYIVETDIYTPVCHTFDAKYVVLKITNSEQKQVRIAEYIL